MAIFQWLEGWYNPHCRHSALGLSFTHQLREVYIAYDELRDDDFLSVDPTLRHNGQVPWIQNRQLAIKIMYLLSP